MEKGTLYLMFSKKVSVCLYLHCKVSQQTNPFFISLHNERNMAQAKCFILWYLNQWEKFMQWELEEKTK